MEDYIAIIISFTSLVISAYFAVKSMKSSSKSNELSESQKTAALISILAPACTEPQQWQLFIKYLAKNNRLPNFSEEDEFFLNSILNKLQVKARIINSRINVEN